MSEVNEHGAQLGGASCWFWLEITDLSPTQNKPQSNRKQFVDRTSPKPPSVAEKFFKKKFAVKLNAARRVG